MLILKRTILLVLILISGIGIAQSKIPFYEQIAFDFYHNEILTKDSIQSRIRVYKEIETYKLTEDLFWPPECLEKFKIVEYDNSRYNLSEKTELNLDYIDQSTFKISKYGKGRYPKLYTSQSLLFSENRILVVLRELHK